MLCPVFSHAEKKMDELEPAVAIKYVFMLGEVLNLQVVRAPLRKVLAELSSVTKIDIHYSVLANELVTATCAGDSLKNVLKCLLGDSQNMVFQYSQDTEKTVGVRKPVDIWILGSSLAKQRTIDGGRSCKGRQSSFETTVKNQQTDKKVLAQLMPRLDSEDSKQRAEAIADLATKTAVDNADVDNILLNAMDDKAVAVREQALFGWVYRKGNDASFELQQALQDSEVSVRIKVIDLTKNRDILTLALVDSSELVRKIATMKLNELELQKNKK